MKRTISLIPMMVALVAAAQSQAEWAAIASAARNETPERAAEICEATQAELRDRARMELAILSTCPIDAAVVQCAPCSKPKSMVKSETCTATLCKREVQCRRLVGATTTENCVATLRSQQTWTVTCEVDAMDDVETCQLEAWGTGDDGLVPFTIYFIGGRGPIVSPGINDYPGRGPRVRVDGHKAISDMSSKALITQLLEGQVVRFAYNEWPHPERRAEFSLDGFAAGYAELLERSGAKLSKPPAAKSPAPKKTGGNKK